MLKKPYSEKNDCYCKKIWWNISIKYLQNDRSGQLDSAAAVLLLDQWLKEGPELKPVNMPAYPIGQVD